MADAAAKHSKPLDIILHGGNTVEHEGNWKTYQDRKSWLDKQRGQAFSMILGHCTQKLPDRIKQDNGWKTTSSSYNPLSLIDMIEKTLLAQTEDHYPFAIVYEQELSLYGFHQNFLTNDQWYEKFNTKVYVGDSIGFTREHEVIMEWTSQDVHKQAFSTLQDAEKEVIRADAAERYLSYIFLRQSAKSS